MAETGAERREYEVELEETGGRHRLVYVLGAVGGVALGLLLHRGFEALAGRGAAERIRGAAGFPERFRPARLRRQPEDHRALLELEDAVLDALLADEVLSERGIDVGAVSPGVVELSGAVWSRTEVRRALAMAQGVAGVRSVINRMDIEDQPPRTRGTRNDSYREGEMSGAEWTGHGSGMGSRRQGRDTDPDRRDDSHWQRERALEAADRAQMEDEGYGANPRLSSTGGDDDVNRTRYADDELDNQRPSGQRASALEQPQALNSLSRVGDAPKPGIELALEAADLPVKPHQRGASEE